MKTKKLFALLLAATLVASILSGCGKKEEAPVTSDPQAPAETQEPAEKTSGNLGPIYDEWSEMTDDELYQQALTEDVEINVYATSSKMLKEVEPFEEAYPGLKLIVSDLDNDEVLSKARIENETGNITADVLQTKDTNGGVFYEYYDLGVIESYYPKDICEHIDDSLLQYGYPLYTSQSFWFYNTKAFPDGQPVTNWWQFIEKKDDGSQKYRLYTKEIGQESAYLALFASFITNADQMAEAYTNLYGENLEYTYDASSFPFEVPENNAGVEYLWRFSQAELTFIGDGDELVLAVHNSTADDPALCLASAGKITNRDESGYDIGWCTSLTPYTGNLNMECLYAVKGSNSPAGSRLLIRYLTGGADGKSGGLKPFSKTGNWPVRDDVVDDWNPAQLSELGAVTNDLSATYDIYLDVQDMWTYWLDQNPNM